MKFIEHLIKRNFHRLYSLKLSIKMHFFLFIPLFFLMGCAKNPAEQCLESFRDDLVSPRSAKAVKLIDGNLTYLAKNRSGTEIQGKAICVQVGEKWARDSSAEYIKILKYSTDILKSNNGCRNEGNPRSYCDMLHPTVTPEIAKINLGYN